MLDKIFDKSKLFAGAFGLILGGTWFCFASKLKGSEEYGYAFFPKIYSGLMAIVGIYLLCRCLYESIINYNNIKEKTEDDARKERMMCFIRVALQMLLCIGYIIVLSYTKFIISTIILLALTLLLFGGKKPIPIAVISIIVPLVLYFVFNNLLNVYLP